MRASSAPSASPHWRDPRIFAVIGLLAAACSGSVSCSGCGGTPLTPIPGGFPDEAEIPRAAQVRVSRTGLDFLETRFSDLVEAYAAQSCGQPEDPPCPSGFNTSCSPAQSVCVDPMGTPQPVLGFEVEFTQQGSATVCRDPLTDPNRRDCHAWLRLEGLGLQPEAPDRVRATVTARVLTSVIPIEFNSGILDLDCIVDLDSARSGSPLQDLELVLQVSSWQPASGTGGGQLQIEVVEVNAQIPDDDIAVAGDPIQGTAGDVLACGGLNALGSLKAALVGQLTDSLAGIIQDEIDELLGWTCGLPTDRPCPATATCNTDGFCEAGGRVVPMELGLEGRLDFASLLGGFGGGRPGETDLSFLVGGQSGADGTGLTVSALGGAELVRLDPTCAQDLPSPRLRPTYGPPPALPTDGQADLDWDGTAETPFMVAAGLSEAFLDQVMWSLYGSGLFCQRISAFDVDLLNTGSLGLLVPSLDQLTHADKYPWAVYPASLTLTPSAEPTIRLGSGEVMTGGASPNLVEPLIAVELDDVRLDFTALIEERWIRLMTVQADLTLGFGAVVTPNNEIELVIGDVASAIRDVRVTNAEILSEDPADLEQSIPALIELALPQITGALPPIALPGAAELGGFDLQVLGVRGVRGATGNQYPNVAVYADLDFVPALAGNLRLQAETSAELVRLEAPAAEAWRSGEPVTAVLALGGEGLAAEALEHQVRVDGGLWSPFFRGGELPLTAAALRVPGPHRIEARARVVGDYRSLDPSPAVVDVVVDPEPPRLDVAWRSDGTGLQVRAMDRVSRDRLQYSLRIDGEAYEVVPEAEVVRWPVALPPTASIEIEVTDEQGLRTAQLVREGSEVRVPVAAEGEGEASGCRCAETRGVPGWLGLGLLAPLFARRRRR